MGARSSLDHLSSWYYHKVMDDGQTVGDHLDAIDRRLTALEELLDTARAFVTARGTDRTPAEHALRFAVFSLLPIGERDDVADAAIDSGHPQYKADHR